MWEIDLIRAWVGTSERPKSAKNVFDGEIGDGLAEPDMQWSLATCVSSVVHKRI